VFGVPLAVSAGATLKKSRPVAPRVCSLEPIGHFNSPRLGTQTTTLSH
jgi:hypothetical protein